MKIIITESQYRLIKEKEEKKTLDEKIKDYITELYNGNREDIVYTYPNAKPKKYFYPPNRNSHFHVVAYAKYPRAGNKLGLPAAIRGMPYIKLSFINSGKPYHDSRHIPYLQKVETLLVISTKEALQPIMDKFNLDGSYIDKLKQIYVDTLNNFGGFNEFGGAIMWIDRTYTLLKGLKSSDKPFNFWFRLARENGLMDGYVEELKNSEGNN